MPYVPVGVNDDNELPPEVRAALAGSDEVAVVVEGTAAPLRARLDALPASASPLVGAFGGVVGRQYGNSYLRYANYDAQPYGLRLPGLIGLDAMLNWANAGYRMQDTVVNAFGPVDAVPAIGEGRSWPTGTRGLVLVGDLLNNLIEPDDARNRATALESMRALIALLGAASRQEQTSFTFSSTPAWSNQALIGNDFSGGSAAYATGTYSPGVESAYADISIPEGVNYLAFMGLATARGASFVVREGADVLGEVSTDQKSYSTQLRAINGRSQIVWRVPGEAARTIRVSVKNGTSSTQQIYAMLDVLLPQTSTPPLIVIVKPSAVPAATHNKPALLSYLRSIPDLVKSEFGRHIIVVDYDAGWNTDTMLGPDRLHPNELGQQHIANAVVRSLAAELNRRNRVAAFGL